MSLWEVVHLHEGVKHMLPMLHEHSNVAYGDSVSECVSILPCTAHLSKRASQTLNMLLHELLLHDADVYQHCLRMVDLAERVCVHMGMTRQERELTGLATLLHDIGKVGVAGTILHKTTGLDDNEWMKIRRHPEIGSRMLMAHGGVFARIAPFVRAHHERWDGGGYPYGLAGEAIPLSARIVTVVDAYDVMVSCRAYKSSGTYEETCVELARCAGSQFDPQIVQATLRVLGWLPVMANFELTWM